MAHHSNQHVNEHDDDDHVIDSKQVQANGLHNGSGALLIDGTGVAGLEHCRQNINKDLMLSNYSAG